MSWAANSVTMASLGLGTWVVLAATDGVEVSEAAPLILVAGVLDTLDGRIARWSGRPTRLGAALDGLVDLVSFGVAPAIVAYAAVLRPLGATGRLVCIGFVAAAAFRLARFRARGASSRRGLPTTMAGGMLAAWLWALQGSAWPSAVGWTTSMALLAALMVSPIRFPRPEAMVRTAGGRIFVGMGLVSVLVGSLWHPAYGVCVAGVLYLLTPALRRFPPGRRAPPRVHAARLPPQATAPPVPPDPTSA